MMIQVEIPPVEIVNGELQFNSDCNAAVDDPIRAARISKNKKKLQELEDIKLVREIDVK